MVIRVEREVREVKRIEEVVGAEIGEVHTKVVEKAQILVLCENVCEYKYQM